MQVLSAECTPPVSLPPCFPWPAREQFSMPTLAMENSKELFVRPRRKPCSRQIPDRAVAPSRHDDKNAAPPAVYQCRGFPGWACRCPEFPAPPGAANVFAPAAPAHTNILRAGDQKVFASHAALHVPPSPPRLRPRRCLAHVGKFFSGCRITGLE